MHTQFHCTGSILFVLLFVLLKTFGHYSTKNTLIKHLHTHHFSQDIIKKAAQKMCSFCLGYDAYFVKEVERPREFTTLKLIVTSLSRVLRPKERQCKFSLSPFLLNSQSLLSEYVVTVFITSI